MSLLDKLWLELVTKYNIDSQISDKWLTIFKSQYEKDAYYNLEYLQIKLQAFENCRQFLSDPFTILLALIFQPVTFEKDSSSVEKSVENCKQFAEETNLLLQDENTMKKVVSLIQQQAVGNVDEETGESNSECTQTDKLYYMDINFSHLGCDYDDYLHQAAQARKEYTLIDDNSYLKLRKKVLEDFLRIPNIYATKYFQEKLENKARENILREINENLK